PNAAVIAPVRWRSSVRRKLAPDMPSGHAAKDVVASGLLARPACKGRAEKNRSFESFESCAAAEVCAISRLVRTMRPITAFSAYQKSDRVGFSQPKTSPGHGSRRRNMIRKLKSGEYRLYSRKKD